MSNCLHEVCFAQACFTIDEKRVVNLARCLGYSMGCSCSKLVGFSNYKVLKSIS